MQWARALSKSDLCDGTHDFLNKKVDIANFIFWEA